jgi:hypothetical protein
VFPPPSIVKALGDRGVTRRWNVFGCAAEVEQKFPGYLGHFEPDAPGTHTMDSVDLGVVLAGEVVLELDDAELL